MKFTNIVDGHEYQLMTLKDYVNLTAVSSQGNDAINIFLTTLLSKYFKLNAVDISKSKMEYYLLHLFMNSFSQHKIDCEYTCSCGCVNSIKLDSVLQIDKTDIPPFTLSEDIRLVLKEPSLFETDVIELINNNITRIQKGDESFDIDNLSDSDIQELYSLITIDVIDKIKNELIKPRVFIHQPVKCNKCGKHDIKKLVGFKSIFETIL